MAFGTFQKSVVDDKVLELAVQIACYRSVASVASQYRLPLAFVEVGSSSMASPLVNVQPPPCPPPQQDTSSPPGFPLDPLSYLVSGTPVLGFTGDLQ